MTTENHIERGENEPQLSGVFIPLTLFDLLFSLDDVNGPEARTDGTRTASSLLASATRGRSGPALLALSVPLGLTSSQIFRVSND